MILVVNIDYTTMPMESFYICPPHMYQGISFIVNLVHHKRKLYGWQVCEEGLLELWPQPYHPRPQVSDDAAGSQQGVRPNAPVNHMVFFLCHGFIKFMYINKILMNTRL